MDYTIYDYNTITIKKEAKYRIMDAVSAFGYEIIETKETPKSVILTLKRDADLKKKEELNQKFDEVMKLINEITSAESKKIKTSKNISIILGIIGLLTFGGGMSAVMKGTGTFGFIAAGITLGIIGVVIMLVNEPIYKYLSSKSLSKYTPIIDKTNNEINNILREANDLIKESFE